LATLAKDVGRWDSNPLYPATQFPEN